MRGRGAALGQEVQELAVVAGHVGRLVRGEVAELEPEDVDALEQDQVEGNAGDGAAGVAHGDEAAAVVQRAQGRLGQVGAHRVDHDVGAVGQCLAQRLAQVAGTVVDQAGGATGLGRLRASRATRRPPSPWRPGRRPSCTAAEPTPPPAPSTTSSSPGCSAATERSTWYAVL